MHLIREKEAVLRVAVAQTVVTPAGKWISNLKYFDNNHYDRGVICLGDSDGV